MHFLFAGTAGETKLLLDYYEQYFAEIGPIIKRQCSPKLQRTYQRHWEFPKPVSSATAAIKLLCEEKEALQHTIRNLGIPRVKCLLKMK